VAHELERRIVEQVGNVAPAPGPEIVDAQHLVAGADQAVAQVRTQESGTPVTSTRFCFE
jgi:hypothetical protein